jgi:hypothetical protein
MAFPQDFESYNHNSNTTNPSINQAINQSPASLSIPPNIYLYRHPVRSMKDAARCP